MNISFFFLFFFLLVIVVYVCFPLYESYEASSCQNKPVWQKFNIDVK